MTETLLANLASGDSPEPPPRWDMTPIFPGLDSDEFRAAYDDVVAGIASLRERFDGAAIRRRDDAEVDAALAEELIGALNSIHDRMRTVDAYIHAFVTTDSRDDLAQALESTMALEYVELSKLVTRFEAWIGSLDVEALIEASEVAREHAFALRKRHTAAKHQMSEAEEDLAATLHPSGQGAWSRLHGSVTSRILVPFQRPGGAAEELPMTTIRALAEDADGAVREAAYRAEIQAWKRAEVPIAAALNSVKGWQDAVNRRRGWDSPLDVSLFSNNVDHATLAAMQEACVESFPDFRRYLRAKARLLGRDALPWWDLLAPAGEAARTWTFDEGAAFIVDKFGTFSDKLAGLADRAFRERWIDAEPREGKRGGGFCMGVRAEQSRILVNYVGGFNSVSTVAHELGHAYHNLNLVERTPMQRSTPMALAETASILCETITTNAMLTDASDAERLSILEADLQGTCQVVVDIHSRFLFETALFDQRAQRELSVTELNEAMLDGQRQTYGDGLDQSTLHPYMWAVKPHYYGSNFYNWPYTFGLLFGLGLYAQYRQDRDTFIAGYDDLLASTGLGDAGTLAGRFGIDVRSADFWRSSLDVIRGQIDEFERLASR